MYLIRTPLSNIWVVLSINKENCTSVLPQICDHICRKKLWKMELLVEVYIICNSKNYCHMAFLRHGPNLHASPMWQLLVSSIFSLSHHELDMMKSLMGMLKSLMQFEPDREKWHLLAIPHSLHPQKIKKSHLAPLSTAPQPPVQVLHFLSI